MADSPLPLSALIGAGSNLGDRLGHLRSGLAELGRLPGIRVHAVSRVYTTPPWGFADQPDFLNLCAALETTLAPLDLLQSLLAVENSHGRDRRGPRYGPRTLDLDLLFVEGVTLASPALTLPHPRWRERPFVVWPLRDLLSYASWRKPFDWKDLENEIARLDPGPEPASTAFA